MRTGSVLVQFSGRKRVDRCRLCNEHREDPGSFSQIPSGEAVNQGKPGDSRVPFFPGRKTNVKGELRGWEMLAWPLLHVGCMASRR